MHTQLEKTARGRNVIHMLTYFKSNPKKHVVSGANQLYGAPVRHTVRILSHLYVMHRAQMSTHQEAVAYALDSAYDHLIDVGTRVGSGEDDYWQPISNNALRFAIDWFERGINWAEHQRIAREEQKKTSPRARTTNERELVSA